MRKDDLTTRKTTKEDNNMAMLMKEKETNVFELVHPLDDVPEEKHSPHGLGPMKMTTSVRLSLIALRTYLIIMGLLVLYSVLSQAGVFGH